MKQWSPVRPITGLAVQAVLTSLAPELLEVQRSCHSTLATKTGTRPCGKCRKDHSLLLYLAAVGVDPARLRFPRNAWRDMMKVRAHARFGLDEEEENHARWMAGQRAPEPSMPGAASLGGKRNPPSMQVRHHAIGAPKDFAPDPWRRPLLDALRTTLQEWA